MLPLDSTHRSGSTPIFYPMTTSQNTHKILTWSKSYIYKPKVYLTTILPEPSFTCEALTIPKWKNAMKSEFDSIIKNTWELVSPPKESKIISNKWVFHTKLNVDRSLHQYKSRVVTKGFHQRIGLDYIEAFSPIVTYCHQGCLEFGFFLKIVYTLVGYKYTLFKWRYCWKGIYGIASWLWR